MSTVEIPVGDSNFLNEWLVALANAKLDFTVKVECNKYIFTLTGGKVGG